MKSEEAEAKIISYVLADETGSRRRELSALRAEHFLSGTTRAVWRACSELVAEGRGLEDLLAVANRAQIELGQLTPLLDGNREGQWNSTAFRVIREESARRTYASIADRLAKDAMPAHEARAEFDRVEETLSALGGGAMQARIEAARLRLDIEPPPLRVVFTLNGVSIATPGNLAVISAQAKAGKTAVIGAAIGSTLSQDLACDFLGMRGFNPSGFAVVHVDSEQALADHWANIKTALRRAKAESAPDWLRSYSTAGWSATDRRLALPEILREAKQAHGGVHAVFLDGVADFVADPNAGEECFPFVDWLHGLGIKFDCPVFTVLHLNPGTEKSRGHLGSQLERRAETNLVLEKDAETGRTVIFSTKQRRAPILKADGPCFRWDDATGMHVSVETVRAERDSQEREELIEIAGDAYVDSTSRRMRYGALVSEIQKTAKCCERTARQKVQQMRRLKVIREVPPKLLELVS